MKTTDILLAVFKAIAITFYICSMVLFLIYLAL